MVVQFSVSNFRSFKDEQILLFKYLDGLKNSDCLIKANDSNLLVPSLALIGSNAAGKSNVLNALKTMQDMVSGHSSKIAKGEKINWDHFVGESEPTLFELIFVFQGELYIYGFSFDEHQIHSEYLSKKSGSTDHLIFEREDGEYEFEENEEELIKISKLTPDNKLFIHSLSTLIDHKDASKVITYFKEQLIFAAAQDEDEASQAAIIKEILKDQEHKKCLIHELKCADFDIADIEVITGSNKQEELKLTHKAYYIDGTLVTSFTSSYDQESAGTKRYLSLICKVLKALEQGAILVVDNIEESIHMLLAARLIKIFNEPTINKHGAQLLFTTHNLMLIELTDLRQDQIWFAEKHHLKLTTETYPLNSFKGVKEEKLVKDILSGRFGAIPQVESY